MEIDLNQTINDILSVTDRAIGVHGTRRPEIGLGDGETGWRYTPEFYWTEAFWPGQPWLAYDHTGHGSGCITTWGSSS